MSNYRNARRTIRDAADKAETVGERVIKGDELQVGFLTKNKKIRQERGEKHQNGRQPPTSDIFLT